MRFTGALIREQGQTFGVIAVPSHILDNRAESDRLRAMASERIFPGCPVVLMANRFGRTTYYGRHDIARFLASIDIRRIPWAEWTYN